MNALSEVWESGVFWSFPFFGFDFAVIMFLEFISGLKCIRILIEVLIVKISRFMCFN